MKQSTPVRVTLTLRHILILLSANALLLMAINWPTIQARIRPLAAISTTTPSKTPQPTWTETPSPTATLSPTASVTQPSITDPLKNDPGPLDQGLLILSIREGGYAHLFAYQPGSLPLTRLTNHAWDDIDPSISPDGRQIAYSSRENGYWDLFLLDLSTGKTTRLTDSAEYKASPTWSPDGQWLAYEDYHNDHLEIFIQSTSDPSQAAIQLTDDQSSDYSPCWSPQGRQVAYVSDQSGAPEIWVADLNKTEDKFNRISRDPTSSAAHPAWSPDGNQLAWSMTAGGISDLFVWNSQKPDEPARMVGNGDWPVWAPSGDLLASRTQMPNQSYLIVYQIASGDVILSPLALPAPMEGFDWKNAVLPDPLPAGFNLARAVTPTPLWTSQIPTVTGVPAGRHTMAEIKDLTAPHPMLEDSVVQSFRALRIRVANELGWDYLSSLENAFVPYSDALTPGTGEDWLYTGRSFASNSVPISAGWMVVVREDFGIDSYWRVYVKTRYQDGSQGRPIPVIPWDLNARFNGDPVVYEQGGMPAAAPPDGYWLDLTDLAQAYGWERLPATINWRTYFPGIRFNQFVNRDGLDWRTAMLQVYPTEFLITTTPILPPTKTPTQTPYWIRPRTPTPTPTFTDTPTRRPTWTPASP